MRSVRLIAVALLVAVFGCQKGMTTKDVEPPSAESQVKSALEHVAETGEIDSGLALCQEELEAMKATDSAKAQELLTDLDELMKMTNNPDGAKAKAKEMLGKL